MRADEKYLYHLDCFTCCLCNVLLKPGDDYGLHGSLLFCRLHLEQTTNTTFSLCSTMKNNSTNQIPTMKKSRQNSTTTTQRKQRTKLNNLENNSNNLEITSKDHIVSPWEIWLFSSSEDFLSGNDLSNSDGNYPSNMFPNPSSSNSQQRTKRNRTSFKHHQLRIMKTFFAQNHNPDSKGLKILSQKTQLSKRVLQVFNPRSFSFIHSFPSHRRFGFKMLELNSVVVYFKNKKINNRKHQHQSTILLMNSYKWSPMMISEVEHPMIEVEQKMKKYSMNSMNSIIRIILRLLQ